MGFDRPCQYVLGVAAVLLLMIGPRAHVIAGRVIEQLVDGGHLLITGPEFEGVKLP